MNVFEMRTFTPDELNNIKIIVKEAATTLQEIKDLSESISENMKGVCNSLNNGIKDKDMKITPKILKKMAVALMKENEIDEMKSEISAVEEGIRLINLAK